MAQLGDFNKVGIVGCGRVGTALGILLGRQLRLASKPALASQPGHAKQQWPAQLRFFDRAPAAAQWAAGLSEAGAAVPTLAELLKDSSLVLVCVPDDIVPAMADELANCGVALDGKLVCHTSGAKSSGEFQALKTDGALIASFHPLQTFPDAQQAAERFAGAYCAIESESEEAAAVLTEFAERLECRPWRLRAENKRLYHAAACLACNYLTALLDASLQVFQAAGMEERQALEALSPLLEATVHNNLEQGPTGSLTGPIARGDSGVVAEHLAALTELSGRGGSTAELDQLYRLLGAFAVRLAVRQKTLAPAKQAELMALLKGAHQGRPHQV